MTATEALRDFFLWQAVAIETSIKSKRRQADEFWAYVLAVDAILMECQGVSEVMETFSLPHF
jgi:hypothetical protein